MDDQTLISHKVYSLNTSKLSHMIGLSSTHKRIWHNKLFSIIRTGLVQLDTGPNPYPDTTHDKRVEEKKKGKWIKKKKMRNIELSQR